MTTDSQDLARIVTTATAPSSLIDQPRSGSVAIVSPARVKSSGSATSRNGAAISERRSTSSGGSFAAATIATVGSASSARASASPSRVSVTAKMQASAASSLRRASQRWIALSRAS